ncbi:uncharacterized protein LOC133091031 [Eubalaena glacialis]|uniref:uncharacterized protein LOC133091031 n=1 Tax=Eubalaena glacialis TaxID=27606 RepID=UPI002A5A79E9|nr:uncharacterized protein LOC133091031 [Eubalaena glacialis]
MPALHSSFEGKRQCKPLGHQSGLLAARACQVAATDQGKRNSHRQCTRKGKGQTRERARGSASLRNSCRGRAEFSRSCEQAPNLLSRIRPRRARPPCLLSQLLCGREEQAENAPEPGAEKKPSECTRDTNGSFGGEIRLRHRRQAGINAIEGSSRLRQGDGLGKAKEIELTLRTSLVAQWLRIRLPMQGIRVRALAWEDPTCRGAAKPVRHNY